ncbi:uncharacterized protein LOC113859976 [Abrus precatorius]|uniref:Uncharacterized protein LOC113859976 n=1 Tax=Abrus precatorius TaxID=3816 RepID=A0A8B8KX24_ABRPR|nr:uncharacterized protein LOC113859976 [Abrus precatorius]
MSSTPPSSPKRNDPSSIPSYSPKKEDPSGFGSNDPSLNPLGPYFIHPSDGPSSVSITLILDGTNYQSWSRAFRMALIFKNKMAFLLGTIPVPSVKETLYFAWEMQHSHHVLVFDFVFPLHCPKRHLPCKCYR